MWQNILTVAGILITIFCTYLTVNFAMTKIKGTKITQVADEMKDTTGADFKLKDGEDLLLEDLNIVQDAKKMEHTTGLKFDISGTQQAKLKDVHVKSNLVEVHVNDVPGIEVTINKQI